MHQSRTAGYLYAVLLVGMAIVGVRIVLQPMDCAIPSPDNDIALIELAVRDAGSFARLLGPYSRLGFNHPGPLLFYLAVPTYELFDQCAFALQTTAALWNALVLGLIGLTALQYRSSYFLFWAILVELFIVYTPARELDLLSRRYEWNNLYLFWNASLVWLPYLLFLLVVPLYVCERGGGRQLLAAVLLASFCAQSFVGLAPSCGLILIVAVGLHHWRYRSNAWNSRTKQAALVLLCVLSLPILLEEMLPGAGNIGRLLAYFSGSTGELSSAGTFQAVTLAKLYSPFLVAWNALGGLEVEGNLVLISRALSVVCVLQCLGAIWLLWRERGIAPETRTLLALGTFSVFPVYLIVSQIRGQLHEHLIEWVSVHGVVWHASMFAVLAEVVASRVRCTARCRPWLAAATLLLAIGYYGVHLNLRVSSDREIMLGFLPRWPDSTRYVQFAHDALAPGEPRTILVRFNGRRMGPLMYAGLMNRLDKEGYRVRADNEVAFLFGRRQTTGPPPECELSFSRKKASLECP